MSTENQLPEDLQIIKFGKEAQAAGLGSTSSQERYIREGRLPPPLEIGPRNRGWTPDMIRRHFAKLEREANAKHDAQRKSPD